MQNALSIYAKLKKGEKRAQQNFMHINLQTLDIIYTHIMGEIHKNKHVIQEKCRTKMNKKYIEMISKPPG